MLGAQLKEQGQLYLFHRIEIQEENKPELPILSLGDAV
jgi:hypothetical protein